MYGIRDCRSREVRPTCDREGHGDLKRVDPTEYASCDRPMVFANICDSLHNDEIAYIFRRSSDDSSIDIRVISTNAFFEDLGFSTDSSMCNYRSYLYEDLKNVFYEQISLAFVGSLCQMSSRALKNLIKQKF
ncbi:hypothetical protein LOAG_01256 [Loa loa]|uniref:Uncharacterized protein n=1 Tax=Loa loa TaxID=7209 RepID=A0A1S0UBF0_LOALO|nr:hypothetical protein LOAG_01256 [Loa loa]EFO27227.1 hypothetical protein LOAG_01256 [Loa loa]